jgi:hypothetical protein
MEQSVESYLNAHLNLFYNSVLFGFTFRRFENINMKHYPVWDEPCHRGASVGEKMNPTELIQEISAKDVNIDKFVELALSDGLIRHEIVCQLLSNPDIMVYYHCYYVVSKASQEKPELFYSYWHEIASLLKHKNSYHRDIALTILANLTKVDQENLFARIFQDYFEHINDQKFMTGQCCVKNSLQIIRNKPELQNQIIDLLLDVDQRCTYPDKQKELLKANVLEVLEETYREASDKKKLTEYANKAVNSISPKTRNKARELVRKYGL